MQLGQRTIDLRACAFVSQQASELIALNNSSWILFVQCIVWFYV